MIKATKHIPMNLQLFADTQPSQADLTAQAMAILQGGGNQPAEATPQQVQSQPTEGSPQNNPQLQDNGGQVPGSQEGQTPNQPPVAEQPGQQAPSQQEQLILGKFKSPDEVVNAYASLEQFNTKTRQELAQERQEKEQLKAALQQMQQQSQQMVQPQAQEPELTPEEANEQLMNKFYENPAQFFNEIKEQAKQELMQQIAPIQEQYQMQQEQARWNEAVNNFATSHQDFQQWQPAMQEVLANNPHIANLPNGLEVAYAMAKGQNYQDPNAILQDQNFVKQNILGNQDIKNQIIQEYLQSLNKGQQAPTVIGGQVGGAMPMTPDNKPQNMDEARNIALKMLQG